MIIKDMTGMNAHPAGILGVLLSGDQDREGLHGDQDRADRLSGLIDHLTDQEDHLLDPEDHLTEDRLLEDHLLGLGLIKVIYYQI